MAILAQQFLDRKHNTDLVSPFDEALVECLCPTSVLENQAQRIVFDEDLYGVLREMVDAGQLDFHLVCRHARMPAGRLWLEWKNMFTSRGGLIDFGTLILPKKDEPGRMLCIVLNNAHGGPTNGDVRVTCAFLADAPPYQQGIKQQAQLLWTFTDGRHDYNEALYKEMAGIVTRTLAFALFLLQQPKIIDSSDVQHASKINKKRAARGKRPLIAYQRITMKFGVLGSRIGQAVRVGSGGSAGGNIREGAGDKRTQRYHYVLGHFRTIHRGEENEIIRWIEPYYKGDASKGVLIRERNLSLRKEG